MKLHCATPLMASSSTANTVTTAKLSSLASSNSLFFTNSRCLYARTTNRRLTLVSGTRKQQPRRPGQQVQCLFGLGVPELVVIAGVAALVFGPRKLPEIGRSIGKTVKSFQEAAKEFETELKGPGETAESSSTEQPKATTSESNKEIKASSTKETA